MAVKYTNNTATTIVGAAGSGATTIVVSSNVGFPVVTTDHFYATIGGAEIVKVTNSVTTSWTVERGADGTAASAYGGGEAVELRIPRAMIEDTFKDSDLNWSTTGTISAPNINAHIANTSNPHGVTKFQVGLDNVTNVNHAAALADHILSVTDHNDVTSAGSGAIITGTERATIGTNAAHVADKTEHIRKWDGAVTYSTDDIVWYVSDDAIYRSLTLHTSIVIPSVDLVNWQVLAVGPTGPSGPSFAVWVNGISYTSGTVVYSNSVDFSENKIYISLTNHTASGSSILDDIANWQELSEPVDDHTALSNIGTKTHATLDTEVAANNAKVSADGSITTHSDVTGAGSGVIISVVERAAIGINATNNAGTVTVHSDVSSAGSGIIISAAERTAIGTNTTNNAGTVTVHSDVTGAGSGIIISAAERTAIGTNTTNNAGTVTVHSDVTDAGSGLIITAGERAAIGTNTTNNTGTVTVHSDVTSAGSGIIITATERTNLGTNTTHSAIVTGNPHVVTKSEVGLGNVPNVDTTNASNITSGTISSSVLPPVALTTVQVAVSEVAMLALTTEEGDVVVRSDENRSYMRNAGLVGNMTDFTELSTPTDSVLSVNSKVGTVILNPDDLSDAATTNKFTTAGEISKLAGIETSATADQTGAEIKAAYEVEVNAYTDTKNTKLAGIETGATADQTDLEIKTAYENNADTNAFTNADESKLDGIEANATADQTGAEIKAAYEVEVSAFTDAQFTKLSGIETGATADQTDLEIKTAYENNADTNAFTNADETKLDGIEAGAQVNDYAAVAPANVTKAAAVVGVVDIAARQDHKHDISTAIAGTIGTANSEGTATTLARSDHGHDHGAQTTGTHHAAVVASGTSGFMTGADKTKLDGIESGATADQTDLEIKTAYENNADTNAFTNADETKLDGIEAGAQVNVYAGVAPTNVTKSAAVVGVASISARQDHKHDISTAAAGTIGIANSEGAATTLARSDHGHDHGAQSIGTHHAAVISNSTSGFMTGADKLKLDQSPVGYSQYSNDVAQTTSVAAFAPISFATNQNSFLNGLFTKTTATTIRVDFTGIIKARYSVYAYPGNNGRAFQVRVALNGAGVVGSEESATGDFNPLRGNSLSDHIFIPVVTNDLITIEWASPELSLITLGIDQGLFSVEAYRIT